PRSHRSARLDRRLTHRTCPGHRCISYTSLARRSRVSSIFPYTTLFRSQMTWALHICQIETVQLCHRSIGVLDRNDPVIIDHDPRSEEHTSELQSRENLVCRLLLEKKKSVLAANACGPAHADAAQTHAAG